VVSVWKQCRSNVQNDELDVDDYCASTGLALCDEKVLPPSGVRRECATYRFSSGGQNADLSLGM